MGVILPLALLIGLVIIIFNKKKNNSTNKADGDYVANDKHRSIKKGCR